MANHKQSFEERDILDILVLGKEAYEVSNTCNSLLGRDDFPLSTNDPQLKYPISKSTTRDDVTVRIHYMPAVVKGMSTEKMDLITEEVKQRLYSAIVLVYRYPVILTVEEMVSMQMTRQLISLTNCTLQAKGIIIFTNGYALRRPGQFEEYIEQRLDDRNSEGKVLSDLIQDVNSRCVLFDNYTDDANVMDMQVDKFFDLCNQFTDETSEVLNKEYVEPYHEKSVLCYIFIDLKKNGYGHFYNISKWFRQKTS